MIKVDLIPAMEKIEWAFEYSEHMSWFVRVIASLEVPFCSFNYAICSYPNIQRNTPWQNVITSSYLVIDYAHSINKYGMPWNIIDWRWFEKEMFFLWCYGVPF